MQELKELVEAAGIEHASQSLLTTSVYVCNPLFGSRPLAACGCAAVGLAREVMDARLATPARKKEASGSQKGGLR